MYDSGNEALMAILRSRLRSLSFLEWNDWREPLFRRLHGNLSGLGEVRFKCDRVQQRPLGFVSGPYEFTLVFWAIEKGGKFVPKSAGNVALTRMAQVEADRSVTRAIWFALE